MRSSSICALMAVAVGVGVLASVGLAADAPAKAALPRLVDLGAGECIPCKKMAPILEALKKDYAGKLTVQFIDVWKNPAAATEYSINLIPTQIFYDATGKERFRHEGFFSREDILAKWAELGVSLAPATAPDSYSRWEPARKDTRAKSAVCNLCDGNVDARTRVVVHTAKGDVHLCSMHHYFVMCSSLTAGLPEVEKGATVTDWSDGKGIPVSAAVYLYALEEATGRPQIKAFRDRAGALAQRAKAGGSLLGYAVLRARELADRCGFCDRAVYPQDAALVKAGGLYTWGCCSHCAMGVAARTGKDIEVHERDRLTGAPIVVKTLNGSVVSIEPATAVAWFGQRTNPDGKHASAGCFHQGFFATARNLVDWAESNPLETGAMITIGNALADKMALSADQITRACKIGECAPR